jgi:hypothetical protein
VRHSIDVHQVGRESIGNHCGVDIEGQEPVERARVCIYRYDEIPAASATEIVSLKKLRSGLLTLARSAQDRPGEQADDQSANNRELGAHAAEFQGNFLLCQVNRHGFDRSGSSLNLSNSRHIVATFTDLGRGASMASAPSIYDGEERIVGQRGSVRGSGAHPSGRLCPGRHLASILGIEELLGVVGTKDGSADRWIRRLPALRNLRRFLNHQKKD